MWHVPAAQSGPLLSMAQPCAVRLRRFASVSGNKGKLDQGTGLRRHLARLWLKVHPDLFSQHPKEQSVNEHSFKLLQEALRANEAASNGRQDLRDPPLWTKPVELSFFYHSQESKLKKTSVTLHRHNLGFALSSLFESLSLPPPPRSVLPRSAVSTFAAEDGGRQGPRAITLTEIVRQAREAGMKSMWAQGKSGEAAARSAEWTKRDSDVRRLVLQRLRGVTILAGSGLPNRGDVVTGVDRLGEVLRRSQDVELAGLRIVIDGGLDVKLNSARATLNLGIYATDALWEEALRSDACISAAAERRALGKLERDAAKAAGLAHILFQDSVEGDTEVVSVDRGDCAEAAQVDYLAYKALLTELSDLKSFILPSASNLSLILVGSSGQETPNAADDVIESSDDAEGVLRVHVRASLSQLFEALRVTGENVAARNRIVRDREEAERTRVWRVARALRIDSLRRGDGITQLQWSQGLDDLIADAGRLGGILDRSAVVIGTESRLISETGEVQLAWNFKKHLKL